MNLIYPKPARDELLNQTHSQGVFSHDLPYSKYKSALSSQFSFTLVETEVTGLERILVMGSSSQLGLGQVKCQSHESNSSLPIFSQRYSHNLRK